MGVSSELAGRDARAAVNSGKDGAWMYMDVHWLHG